MRHADLMRFCRHAQRVLGVLVVLSGLGLSSQVSAQPTPYNLSVDARSAPDLPLPSEVTPIEAANYPKMMLLKPDGEGPFPALVLGHQCGGLVFSRSNPNIANWSMLQWAKDFHAAGYVVLFLDFMGPRGATMVCNGPQNGVTLGRSVQDFFQASAHMRALPYVNPQKVGLVGFSQGAFLAFFVNSKSYREAFKQPRGFDAYVSFYPPCRFMLRGTGAMADLVQPDIEKPQLVLVGTRDNEAPYSDCQSTIAPIEKAGKPMSIHTYEDASHCWDCKSLDGFSKPGRHGTVTYTYNPAASQDSLQRSLAFLRQSLALP